MSIAMISVFPSFCPLSAFRAIPYAAILLIVAKSVYESVFFFWDDGEAYLSIPLHKGFSPPNFRFKLVLVAAGMK